MSKYPGRLISATPPSVSTSAASGVWTLEDVARYRQAGQWPVGVSGADPYFNQTVMLLHGDGNQGANNIYNPGPPRYLAFTDNSDNNFPITVQGDAYGDNFSPFMVEEGQWSNYFDGTGDYLRVADDAALDFGTGDFTIESWFYIDKNANADNDGNRQGALVASIRDSGIPVDGFVLLVNGNPTTTGTGLLFRNYVNGSLFDISYTGTIAQNTWHHVAVSRSGTTTRIFLNGSQVTSGTLGNQNVNSSVAFKIGALFYANYPWYFPGYISNIRVVKGRAVYTSNFTPSTTPLGATSGGQNPPQGTETSLLTCQSNRFVDNSSSPKTLTINGDVSVKPFNPFTTTYNSTDGSGYFDGSDYLTLPSNSALTLDGDFTVEFWVYLPSIAASQTFWSKNTQTIQYDSTSGNWLFYNGSTSRVCGSARAGMWQYVAISRTGSTLECYLDGVRGSTSTDTTTLDFSASSLGYRTISPAGFYITGYLAGIRFIKGSGVYSGSTMTIPTAPLTAVTNTQLLTLQYQGSVRNVGFIDSSPYDHVITRNGNTTQGTFSPFSAEPGKWAISSTVTPSAGGKIDVAANGQLFGSGTWTYETWAYFTAPATGDNTNLVSINNTVYPNRWVIDVSITSSSFTLRVITESNGILFNSTSVAQNLLNQWIHIAVVNNTTNNTLTLYLNGQNIGSRANVTLTAANTINLLSESSAVTGSRVVYISNTRVVQGLAVYTQNFTPDTSPLTAIAGTGLLLNSNRFFDSSGNNRTITPSSVARVTPFSPFAPTAAYDPAVNGGSGYFDGTGDKLTVAANAAFQFGTGDFAIEFWLYPTSLSSYQTAIDMGYNASGSYVVQTGNGNGIPVFYSAGSALLTSSSAWTANAFNHVVVCRSGTTLSMFINGSRTATATNSTNLNSNSTLGIGAAATNSPDYPVVGYMSNFRLVKGSSVYDPTQTTLTVPTSPLTAIANTSFLCNFTNAGIFDQTGKNVLETVGNAQVDTSVKKFGTGSMKFDGTGDFLVPSGDPNNFAYGSGNFTIEFWLYLNTVDTLKVVYEGRVGGLTAVPTIYVLNTLLRYFAAGGNQITGPNLSASTWYHIAVARSGTSTKMFVDGTQVGSTYTDSTVYTNVLGGPIIGAQDLAGSSPMNGYIDDLRITKGVARYTSNFTAPTRAYADQ